MENKKSMACKGFSLIELMVVIAIIGVLASLAISTYRNYTTIATASSIVPLVDSLIEQSIAFSQTHGRFGNAYDLGLAASPNNGPNGYAANAWEFVDPAVANKMNKLFDSPTIDGTYPWLDLTIGEPANPQLGQQACGRIGVVTAGLDPVLLGFPAPDANTNGNLIRFACYFWHYQGTIYKGCDYFNGMQGGGNTPDNKLTLIPEWSGGSSTGPDFLNSTTYLNATCQ